MYQVQVDQSHCIPPELWMETFSYLPSKDLINLSQVSQLFYIIANHQSLWKGQLRLDFPNTHAHLSKKQIVQQTENENKRRKLDPPKEIDWKQQYIERVLFFSAARKNQLKSTMLLKKMVDCFDFLDGRIYASTTNKIFTSIDSTTSQLVTFTSSEEPISIEAKNHYITSIKAEKRQDGKLYVYTGTFLGNIIAWEFCETHFEKRMELQDGHKDCILTLDIYQNFLISADHYEVRIWDKETGTILEQFLPGGELDGFSSLTISRGRILAGTVCGVINIWDVNLRELITTIDNSKKLMDSIKNIIVRNEKVFYSTCKGIYRLDLSTKLTKKIFSSEYCLPFDVWDNQIFIIENTNAITRGVKMLDTETLIKSEIFSADECPVIGMKVGPYGILQNVYINGGTALRLIQRKT